jgi:hypothetical protein
LPVAERKQTVRSHRWLVHFQDAGFVPILRVFVAFRRPLPPRIAPVGGPDGQFGVDKGGNIVIRVI